jgi:predicted nucleotidyltransferase component of viral defense system
MSKEIPSDIAASVRQRLLSIRRSTGEDFHLLLTCYAVERCLYRLSKTAHANKFVLKGAMLFRVWTKEHHRPTTDLDLLMYGDGSIERLREVFYDVCNVSVEPDGLQFDANSIIITDIRENQEYHGQRVAILVKLGKARILLQIDVGFGDVVATMEPAEYPALLDFPAPRLRMYPKEFVISEKLQAMVVLAELNSRMKDFYDIWFMSHQFPFNGQVLMRAIKKTFERRRTELSRDMPVALQVSFADDLIKQNQWETFVKRNKLDAPFHNLGNLIAEIAKFLVPPLEAAAMGSDFKFHWRAGGPWKSKK